MHRFYIPLDGQPHTVRLASEPHALAITELGVEFWAEPGGQLRRLQVFDRGQPLPGGAVMVGEARSGHGLIWWLYEVLPD